MKAAIIIFFYVAILPLIMCHLDNWLYLNLEKSVRNKENINGLFQPDLKGHLSSTAHTSIYKGKLLKPIEREVAMKFTDIGHRKEAEKEYEIYTYLGAIGNVYVERYGIPTVYYYGEWNGYIMIAITLLDSEYKKSLNSVKKLKDIEIMILAREFVKISKYLHCRGVLHNDFGLADFMFRKHQLFIIDFNSSEKMYDETSAIVVGTPHIRDYADKQREILTTDWSQFLTGICEYIGVDNEWFDSLSKIDINDRYVDLNQYSNLKIDIPNKEEFLQVFDEFSVYKRKLADRSIEDTTRFQLYDELYNIINTEIEKIQQPKPILVSWLTDEDKNKAIQELQSKQLPDISSIEDCFANIDDKYPEVIPNYFKHMEVLTKKHHKSKA